MVKAGDWDEVHCDVLIDELWQLRESMLEVESQLAAQIKAVGRDYRPSARNLAHYLALRQKDHRLLQERLAVLGVSSLGRAEAHVLANLDKVLGILYRLRGRPWQSHAVEEPIGFEQSRKLLDKHTSALLGKPAPGRRVRIMVTLPSEAANDPDLVHRLVAAGMDIARINCAHDDAKAWRAMARHVRRAAKATKHPVRILMDLCGPKLRTGPLPNTACVAKLRPQRDDFGRVTAPARLGLYAATRPARIEGADLCVGVAGDWLARLAVNDSLTTTDTRGAQRKLRIVETRRDGVLAECDQTVYLAPGTLIKHRHNKSRNASATPIVELPCKPASLTLHRGDMLLLTAGKAGTGITADGRAEISCTLPEIISQVREGEPIWFDDGRIGGQILRVAPQELEVRITHARETGERLAGDKGINLPESALNLPALTAKDLEDLVVVAKEADLVGLSFVQRTSDVEELRKHLRNLHAEHLGIILKIETRRSFENLPQLLFAAMTCKAAGIMIARGDLAVECGYERLAEVQEEILWAAEAAHLPVIWATQVLETMAKTGRPSRAEITDAAMGERAECVMLNKGPHIVDAIRALDDILRRMQDHQKKKRSLLRALKSWRIGHQEPASVGKAPST